MPKDIATNRETKPGVEVNFSDDGCEPSPFYKQEKNKQRIDCI